MHTEFKQMFRLHINENCCSIHITTNSHAVLKIKQQHNIIIFVLTQGSSAECPQITQFLNLAKNCQDYECTHQN